MSITELVDISHYYGKNPDYVIAGGGNTSWKERTELGDFLYIKGSGTSLADIRAEGFVKMNRAVLAAVWEKTYSQDADMREAEVLAALMSSRAAGEEHKRPSVETLLHDIMPFDYVVHTHPALVNGLLCSKEGEKAAMRLFAQEQPPIWVPAADPGWTLASQIKREADIYLKKYGMPPLLILLQNHGVFVGADTINEIKDIYARIENIIKAQIKREADFGGSVSRYENSWQISEYLRRALATSYGVGCAVQFARDNEIARFVESRAAFWPVSSAFTPDHIVYSGSHPLFLEKSTMLSADGVEEEVRFYIENIRPPKIIAAQGLGVFGAGASEKAADLALALFRDTMRVAVYAESFGGCCFMPQARIDFINNWEVERYRSQVSGAG